MAFADKVEAIEAADNATDEDDDVLAVKSKSRAEEMPAACCRLATTVATSNQSAISICNNNNDNDSRLSKINDNIITAVGNVLYWHHPPPQANVGRLDGRVVASGSRYMPTSSGNKQPPAYKRRVAI